MATVVDIHQAKIHLSELLARIARGEEVVIADAGTPVARLVPIAQRPSKRMAGTWRGTFEMGDDFDAPLPPDFMRAFE
jgi:prevent-host-death family protein